MQSANTAVCEAPDNGVSSHDVMDKIVGLEPSSPLYQVRHGREKVAVAMQNNYDVFFDAQAKGLSLAERLLVAVYASVLSRSTALCKHYRQALDGCSVELDVLESVLNDSLDGLDNTRLRAILAFTRKLIVKPVEGDEAEIRRLQQAGVATPDIITLAQLIAFLSYQIRVAAGLFAMKGFAEK